MEVPLFLTHPLIDSAALISVTDALGNIIYVNDKFCDISGYEFNEVLGRNHRILNSGSHPKSFWEQMYRVTTRDRKVWNSIVTNRSKYNTLYYVDTYIWADFDDQGNLLGWASVRQDVTNIIESLNEISLKNMYLEHAAKILRHDMHSGINTYIPRGLNSIIRRLPQDIIEQYKLESPIKLLQEGLTHTQKVYKGVKEFTNLVRPNAVLETAPINVKLALSSYLNGTSYKDQVYINELPLLNVNEPLFCTAVDNLIRNGLKYNDSDTKLVEIYMLDDITLAVEDNGRGFSSEDFRIYLRPYSRRKDQKEGGTGIGLGIANAIMKVHGFDLSCSRLNNGTRFEVKIS
jgi:chemotaxis family two-component system sensor kinase Cph1